MKNKKTDPNHSFWSGYALGAFTAGVLTFAMGTKTGRTKIKQAIEYMDAHDDSSDLFEALSGKIEDMLDTYYTSKNKEKKKPPAEDMHSIIKKVRTVTSADTDILSRKFFKK